MKVVFIINDTLGVTSTLVEEQLSLVETNLDKISDISFIFYGFGSSKENVDLPLIPECSLIKISTEYIVLENVFPVENTLNNILEVLNKKIFTLLVFDSSTLSKQLMTRIAYRQKIGSKLNVKQLKIGKENELTVSAYSNNVDVDIKFDIFPIAIIPEKGMKTERALEWIKAEAEFISCNDATDISNTVSKVSLVQNDVNLEKAKRVIISGRGIGSKLEHKRLLDIADKIGYEAAATRPVVMNGWAPMDRLIGVSGHILSAEKVIVVGASGSAAFSAGIENCGKILSVNIDEEAMITGQSDVVLIMDSKEFIAKVTADLKD